MANELHGIEFMKARSQIRPEASRGNRRRDGGFTLVEILIALVVVSVGLLGVAGLHAWSLRNNYDALIRSHASALASDIADRMRANRDAALVAGSEYNASYGAVSGATSVATADVVRWKNVLATQLPGGDGKILVAGPPSRIVTITIKWGERGETLEFQTQTEI